MKLFLRNASCRGKLCSVASNKCAIIIIIIIII